MSNRGPKQKNTRKHWALPLPHEIEDALTYFSEKPRKPIKRTINFKLQQPTRRKTRLLLEVHVYLTNMIATMLKAWQDDCQKPSEHGLIAHIFKTQKSGVYGRFRSSVMSDAIQDYFEPTFESTNPHIASRVLVGSYRSCAQMLVNWAQKTANILAAGRKNTVLLNQHIFYEGWARSNRVYRRAMQVVVSLAHDPEDVSWDKPHRLERRSKYEARWILQRLRPESEIRQALAYIEALLDDEPSTLEREAASIEHPWLKQPSGQVRHHRSIRQSWFLQRVVDTPGNLALLSHFNRNELEDLRDQLQTMLVYINRGQQLIENLDHHEAASAKGVQNAKSHNRVIKEGRTSSANDSSDSQPKTSLLTILETFLYAKPPRLPSVQHVRLANDIEEDQVQMVWYDTNHDHSAHHRREHPTKIYMRQLSWFRFNPYRKNDADRFASAKNEAKAVHGLFRTLRALKIPALQPIHFIGTTRPTSYRDSKRIQGQYRDFALLYEKTFHIDRKTGKQREDYRYVLATFIHESYDSIEIEAEREEKERRSSEVAQYRLRRQENPLHYVNFPYTPFQPPTNRQVILFPLECGHAYHEEQFLQGIIETQRKAQEEAHTAANQQSKKQLPIKKCLPEFAPIASAKITCTWKTPQQPEFYLHATITEPFEEAQPTPLRVIGISIYDNRYAYAVLELDGSVRHVGNIFIPRYLNPAFGAKRNSNNYIYWIANSIVEEALWWQAHIGLQDVSWQKGRASVDHAVNQRMFGMPVQRIASAIATKAQVAGLMRPRSIHDVSPAYDCAACQTRLHKGVKTLSNEWSMTCPNCRRQQKLGEGATKQVCAHCDHILPSHEAHIRFEQVFSCPRCYAQPRLARHNLAIVVAQKTLIDVVKHHHNALEKEKRERAEAS